VISLSVCSRRATVVTPARLTPSICARKDVRQRKDVAARAIVRHEQPPREPRFQMMKAAATRRLRDLRHQDIEVPIENLLQLRRCLRAPAAAAGQSSAAPSQHPASALQRRRLDIEQDGESE
jgi:hypothetical protein